MFLPENEKLIREIQRLSKDEIEELFYSSGWKDSEAEEGKALPERRINEILGWRGESLIDTFIQESGIEFVEKKLKEIKK